MAINFTINGKPYSVSISELPIDITLNNFIREHVQLSGTKFMCLEGGCGACICVIKGRHPATNEHKTWATNSCLTLLNVCDGWDIITIEGIGNKKDGYHPIQERLAHLNGTQCGYCSPAMVMNMYGLLESKNGKISMEEIENSFGGNICRCTGYRPILDAMKSFASDFDAKFLNMSISDIEDLELKKCPKTGNLCSGTSKSNEKLQVVYEDGSQWYSAKSISEIFDAFGKIGNNPYMLVAGNTGHGVYRRSPDINTFIAVNKVAELHKYNIGETLELSGNLSLTETMDIFLEAAKKPGFEYCEVIYHHFDLIANVPVRNMGTLAGNLSLKNQHIEFPSDIFITFEATDAKVVVMDDATTSRTISLQEYLKTDMNKKIIKSFILSKYPANEYHFDSYKIMPRAQNAHAYVNAAFLIKLGSDNGNVQSARLCFGGINPEFMHAVQTEKFLIGKDLFDNKTIQGAMAALKSELKPDWILPDASPQYREILAAGLFYKSILGHVPLTKCKKEYKSGGSILQREVSRGLQTFEIHEDKYPLTKPMPKLEALVQCSGEAKYSNDIPNLPDQAWAAFVVATEVNSQIVKIDADEALKVPGVIAFFSKKDIPGRNSFVNSKMLGFMVDEEIFVGDKVKYHSQPLGVIIAKSTKIAEFAAQKVKVMYEKLQGPILPTMKDVFEHKAFDRLCEGVQFGGKQSHCKLFKKDSQKITGNLEIGSQYHYTMEPQTTICIPTEDGIEVHSAAQWMDFTQTVLAEMLNVKKNSIRLQVRRLGGAYGAKTSRGVLAACACALACQLLNRPIRFVQTLESMMSSLGKRFACRNDYEVEVDKNGKITKLTNDFYEDSGCSPNESPVQFLSMLCFQNCYKHDESWKVSGKEVITDAPSHTFCRAPGAVEGIAMIETIMEHIAKELDLDPMDVRLMNIPNDNKMKKLLPDYMNKIDYRGRKAEIDKFNKENRWIKRGIGIAVMQYPIEYFGNYPALVSIFQPDGTVSISHGGIEMGQGINTKVAQVAAYTLGIPMEMIKIVPSDTVISANSIASGGSVASESVCLAVKRACEDLLSRLKPIKDKNKDAPWAEIITKAYQENMSLVATNSAKLGDIKTYGVWGIGCSEVEVDILTGNLNVKRVDILEDTGESLSPLIDIGQIEGSFVMGLGYWFTEQLVYNQTNGEILTNRTWTYKPPGVKDIPIDFRIDLVQKSPNPAGVLRSKTAAEPPVCVAISALFAVRHALDSARKDAGIKDKWYHLGAPTMPEQIVLHSGSNEKMFNLL